jgi:hypothetical protein
MLAAGLALGALVVLIIAASLRADPSGMGTHKQLGLPVCGWIAASSVPCPTCGMTTSFANAASCRPIAAFISQPMGAFLALASAAGFWGCVHVLVFGSRVGAVAINMLRPRLLWLIAAFWAASWIYKVLVQRPG